MLRKYPLRQNSYPMASSERATKGKASKTGRHNVMVLAIGHGIYVCAISIDLTVTGLAGYSLANNKVLATLPFSMITVASAVATFFTAFIIQRLGQRRTFTLGSLVCALGGGISAWSVYAGHFWGFCIGTASIGLFQAIAQYYRLAAADCAEEREKGPAVSRVLTGGVIAAIIGPMLAAWGNTLVQAIPFIGAYFVVALLGLLSAGLLFTIYRDVEPATEAKRLRKPMPPRSLSTIVTRPIFITAVLNSAIGNAVMMLIMTAAPLASVSYGHSIADGANIMQWHLVGMFAPSLFTGWLIIRCGVTSILLTGIMLITGCSAIAMDATDLPHFYAALMCLGIGWNFMYVGGTTLLTRSYLYTERVVAQAVGESFRYTFSAGATFIAGYLLELYGWSTVNLAVLPLLGICALFTVWWALKDRYGKIKEGPCLDLAHDRNLEEKTTLARGKPR
jgi:MFS family permease